MGRRDDHTTEKRLKMWSSEITTVTCPKDIPITGNREEFGGSSRREMKIKIKLLVWSVFSYLCQDKQSSNSSPRVKVGWRREQVQPSSKHSSTDNTTSQGTLVCLGLKLHQQTANSGVWGHFGARGQIPWDHRDEGQWTAGSVRCPEQSLQDPPLCVLCSLQLTQEPQRGLDWTRAPGAKFLFLFYFLRIQLSETFWLAQALLSSKQMQFFTKKDNSQVEFPLLSFSIRREN